MLEFTFSHDQNRKKTTPHNLNNSSVHPAEGMIKTEKLILTFENK